MAHGKKYRLSEEIELFADQDPGKDVFEAVKRIKKLAPGSTITIGSDPSSDKKIKVTTPWYRVAAADPEGKGVGAGWVSGAALAALADKTEQNKLEMVE